MALWSRFYLWSKRSKFFSSSFLVVETKKLCWRRTVQWMKVFFDSRIIDYPVGLIIVYCLFNVFLSYSPEIVHGNFFSNLISSTFNKTFDLKKILFYQAKLFQQFLNLFFLDFCSMKKIKLKIFDRFDLAITKNHKASSLKVFVLFLMKRNSMSINLNSKLLDQCFSQQVWRTTSSRISFFPKRKNKLLLQIMGIFSYFNYRAGKIYLFKKRDIH